MRDREGSRRGRCIVRMEIGVQDCGQGRYDGDGVAGVDAIEESKGMGSGGVKYRGCGG